MSTTLTACLAKMEVRAKYVQEHVSLQQALWTAWGMANNEDTPTVWIEVEEFIQRVSAFVSENSGMFPNRELHLEQYGLLLEIAKYRRYTA